MATSQHKVKEHAEEILDIINKVEKLGWNSIKAKAEKDKYGDYYITISGYMKDIPDGRFEGAENAIMCQVTRTFPNAVVKVSRTKKKDISQAIRFTLLEDEMLLLTRVKK